MKKSFTMQTVYEFAAAKGFTAEDVIIEAQHNYYYDEATDTETEGEVECYTVYFGVEYEEEWFFYFDSLDEPATEWEHHVSDGWEV